MILSPLMKCSSLSCFSVFFPPSFSLLLFHLIFDVKWVVQRAFATVKKVREKWKNLGFMCRQDWILHLRLNLSVSQNFIFKNQSAQQIHTHKHTQACTPYLLTTDSILLCSVNWRITDSETIGQIILELWCWYFKLIRYPRQKDSFIPSVCSSQVKTGNIL